MSGVNDLAKRWDNTEAAMGERYMGRVDAAADLVMLAETAWKPVSEPPTEADTLGVVPLVIVSGGEGADCWDYRDVQKAAESDEAWAKGLYWARIRDVVLMPPQGGE